MAETIASQIAIYLNKDVEKVSEINLYKEGDRTCYNQQLINCTLDKCWKECLEMSNYIERKQDLQKFNKLVNTRIFSNFMFSFSEKINTKREV